MYGCTLQILGKQLKLATYTSLFLNILEVGGTILEQKKKILVNFMEVTASKNHCLCTYVDLCTLLQTNA